MADYRPRRLLFVHYLEGGRGCRHGGRGGCRQGGEREEPLTQVMLRQLQDISDIKKLIKFIRVTNITVSLPL